MLETVHEYAREKLEESGEAEELRRLHARYFLALAEEAEPELKGARQYEWLERLEAEHDNMRVALSHGCSKTEMWSRGCAWQGVAAVLARARLFRRGEEVARASAG